MRRTTSVSVPLETTTVNSAEDELGAHTRASLDAFLRALDEKIAAIELPLIPKPGGQLGDANPTMDALLGQVEQLCTQRAVNVREQHRWFVEAERAIREDDDVRAKEALARHAEHLQLAQDADAQLTEFRSLITDVLRTLSQEDDSATGAQGKDAG